MAFLFQDQNQGIRNDVSPRANARRPPQTVLFHPDCNRRLRNHTESADPSPPELPGKKALAGLGCFTLTAGGDFHPALRTSAARYERPNGNYGESPGRQQAASASGICMSPCRQSDTAGGAPREFGQKLTIGAGRSDAPRLHSARRTRHARIRFRFVLKLIIEPAMSCGRAPLCLWTDSCCGCADSANHIT